MLNNKGMSLMEILVSIVLISIVLVFLFNLLIDLKNESKNNDYAYNNQINRTEFIYNVENDLQRYKLISIKDNSTFENLKIELNYQIDGEIKKAIIETNINEDTSYLKYQGLNENYTYKMNGAEINPCTYFTSYIDEITNEYYFKLNIFIYNNPYHERNNLNYNNKLDDIEISYVGNLSNVTEEDDNLIRNNYTNEKIGACAN